jgi:hypothetical protein
MALGLLGALLFLSLLLVHVPATLWAGNTAEFHSRFTAFLRLGLAALLGGLLLVFVVMALLPPGARRVVAALLCAISLVAWTYAVFLAGGMTVLNGIDRPMDFDTRLGAWELALVAMAYILIGAAVLRGRRTATAALIVLNIGLAAVTAQAVASAGGKRVRAPIAQDARAVFRFSSRDNVLVVLLDGVQADVVSGIFRADAALASAFDGFRFHRDTVGVAPTTFVSMPAIHSGHGYRGQVALAAYFDESIRNRSFMSRFADAGYDTTLVNPVEGVCPDRVRTCVSSAQILRTGNAQLTSESLRLFDVSLFRLVPIWMKRRVYADGNWFLAGRFGLAEEMSRIFEHNLLLGEMAARLTVVDGPPTLKFVHSLSTHTPWVLADDCRSLMRTEEKLRRPQTRCALLALGDLLEALAAKGVYDRTEIFVLADHGMGRPNEFIARASQRSRRWARRAGSANPLFLMKPRRAHGPIADDPAPVYLPDLGATACASSGACTAPGVPAGQASASRVRRYVDYEWTHDFWRLREVPEMTAYDVQGPVWDPGAWKRVEKEGN